MRLPQPMAGLAILPAKRGDEQKLSEALHKLQLEDPCVKVEHNASTNETVLRGMGELHLRVILERMHERYNVEVETRPPRIAYRETITVPAEGHHRHKKQTGGAGQFGEVYLRVAPLARGAGFEFVDDVVGGTIPGQFIPAVEKGVRQVLETGAIAGYPLAGHPRIRLRRQAPPGGLKGSGVRHRGQEGLHRRHPEGAAYRARAYRQAAGDGAEQHDGRSHRRSVRATRAHPRQHHAPRAIASPSRARCRSGEIENYQSRLKSLTGGEGSFNIELDRYEAVPPQKQQELVNAFKPHHED